MGSRCPKAHFQPAGPSPTLLGPEPWRPSSLPSPTTRRPASPPTLTSENLAGTFGRSRLSLLLQGAPQGLGPHVSGRHDSRASGGLPTTGTELLPWREPPSSCSERKWSQAHCRSMGRFPQKVLLIELGVSFRQQNPPPLGGSQHLCSVPDTWVGQQLLALLETQYFSLQQKSKKTPPVHRPAKEVLLKSVPWDFQEETALSVTPAPHVFGHFGVLSIWGVIGLVQEVPRSSSPFPPWAHGPSASVPDRGPGGRDSHRPQAVSLPPT